MPLHVNLYHEVQQQERARRRDPLRLGMLAALIAAIGLVVNYFIVLERAHSINIRYSALEEQWSKIEPKAKDAKDRQDELNAEVTASDAMMKNVDSRFFWAPVLDQILKTVPRNVQLTHVSADMPTNENSLDSVISLSGISSASEPRKEAETVRTALDAKLASNFKGVTSAFKSLEDTDEAVTLDGRRLATATFTMEFQIQVRTPVVVAPPVATHHRSADSE